MANIKSAEKRIRTSAQKRSRNRTRVSRLRTAVKKYGTTDAGKRGEVLSATHSEIDRALAKGVIHRNAAARYKSRLAKKAAAK
jgi:small subunit ribosomal protein S20